MDTIRRISKLIGPASHTQKIRFAYFFNSFKDSGIINSNPHIKLGIDIVKSEIPYIREMTGESEESLWTRSMGFLVWCIIYACCLDKHDCYEKLAYLVVTYLYVDTALDGHTGLEMLNDLREYIYSRKVTNHNSRLVNAYLKYECGNEKVNEAAKKLLLSEIQSVSIQENLTLTKEEYQDITVKKSMYTVLLVNEIMDVSIDDDLLYLISYTGQVYDDLMDYPEDLKNNIETLITYDFKRHGIIDQSYGEFVEVVNRLPDRFNIMKMFFYLGTLYTIGKYGNISPSLFRKLDPYILFDPRYGVNMDVIFK